MSSQSTFVTRPAPNTAPDERPGLDPSSLLGRPVLIIGVGGMLFRAWAALLDQNNVAYQAPGLDELDLTRADTIHRWLDAVRPALVINCAAYTNVDQAEREEALATAINGTGVGDLATCCQQRGIHLVHYSTDYVFDGEASRPYRPDDARRPMGAYGRSKALGEELIEKAGGTHLIIRTSWLYAPWGRNFVRTIVSVIGQKKPLKIVNDQRGRPTSAENLARTSLELIRVGACGIYHVTDGGECTWFEFGREIGRNTDPLYAIEPCTTAQFPRPAKRPAYSVLDLGATEAKVGPMTPWPQALADVMRRLEP